MKKIQKKHETKARDLMKLVYIEQRATGGTVEDFGELATCLLRIQNTFNRTKLFALDIILKDKDATPVYEEGLRRLEMLEANYRTPSEDVEK
jgi:hypothetical protein